MSLWWRLRVGRFCSKSKVTTSTASWLSALFWAPRILSLPNQLLTAATFVGTFVGVSSPFNGLVVVPLPYKFLPVHHGANFDGKVELFAMHTCIWAWTSEAKIELFVKDSSVVVLANLGLQWRSAGLVFLPGPKIKKRKLKP